MAKYTENFNLIKPEDDEYYDVADFNENMDIIDEALAESAGGSDKIGEPEDSILSTVFGKLNGFISPDGKGVRIVKSIQRCSSRLPVCTPDARTMDFALEPVNPSRCLVWMERLHDTTSGQGSISYQLQEDNLHLSYHYTGSHSITIGFWIIDFY